MPIIPTAADQGLRRRAVAEASAAAPPRTPGEEAALGALHVSPQASPPLPIYSIPLDAFRQAGNLIAGAQLSGWRVPTMDRGVWHLVDFAGAFPGGRASTIHHPGAADQLLRAGSFAAEQAAEGVDYSPRILELAWLGFTALWLYGSDGSSRFFTLRDPPHEWSQEEVVGLLRARADRRLAAASAPPAAEKAGDLGG